MSLRSMSRVLPRAVSRPTYALASRPLCAFRHSSQSLQSLRIAPTNRFAPFSTSRIARDALSSTDQELSSKLQRELELENEMRDSDKLPAPISDFLQSSQFELHDKPGQEEVLLTRKFNDETIRVTFSIADLNNMDPENDPYDDEENALEDEEEEEEKEAAAAAASNAQSGGANTKGTIAQGRIPDDSIRFSPRDRTSPANREETAPGDGESTEEGGPGPASDEPSFPARMNVAIEKKGKGTLQIETTAQDGTVTIDSVNFFKDTKVAEPTSAEAQWKRSGLYEGPPFANLDEDLQVLLERYLDDRGVNTQLALWVPEYIDFKEQREYLGWLSNVKKFVDE